MARIEIDDHSRPDDPEDLCRFALTNDGRREGKGGDVKKKKKKRRTVLTYDPQWSRSAYKNYVQPETVLSLFTP